MACSTCNTPNCGCSGTYVVSATCPPACSEVFNSACIVYTGVDITCINSQTGLSSTVVSRNDYLDTALTSIINFFCARINESLTSTVVTTASAPYLAVTSSVVGSTTTYSVDIDIAEIQAAVDGMTTVVAAGGTNVIVDIATIGSVTTYTVTAMGTDVQSGDNFIDVATTQVGDDDVVTLTLDIAEVAAALGDVSVAQGTSTNVTVTTVNNFPTTGDTQYRLDVVATDVVSADPLNILTVAQSGGTAPAFDQLFTLDIAQDALAEFLMDAVGAILPGLVGGIVGTGGITVGYNTTTHTVTIGETIGVPDQWKILSDGVTDIPATDPSDKLRIVAGTGASVGLAAGPGANEATFTITNTDLGSSQLIFGSVDCNNGGASIGTATASTNTDTLTMVGGDDITLGVAGNTITINNDIDHVYSDVIGDDAVSLQAGTTTSTLEVIGGTGISTSGVAGPTNQLTITNDSPATSVALTSAGGTETLVNDGVGPALANKGLTAGSGISLSSDAVSVTIVADVQRQRLQTVGYTAGDPALSITHGLVETYVNVRAFDGLNDVTNVGANAVITMVNSTSFTISHADRNITDILVIG